jgi:hypothetical protein
LKTEVGKNSKKEYILRNPKMGKQTREKITAKRASSCRTHSFRLYIILAGDENTVSTPMYSTN